MMLFGFRTFGGAAQTLLLNNYHRTEDPLASLARLATGFSILCGFPLMFAALKTSFFNAASEISEKFGEGGMKMARRFQSDEGLRVGKKGRGTEKSTAEREGRGEGGREGGTKVSVMTCRRDGPMFAGDKCRHVVSTFNTEILLFFSAMEGRWQEPHRA